MAEMKIDLTDFENKLETLTGYDFEMAEKLERLNGNPALEMNLSKGFQIRLAARALNIPADDLKALPMRQYNQICNRVTNFLYKDSEIKIA